MGIAVRNPAETVLWRAIIAMGVCYVVGQVAGSVAQQAVQSHIDKYKKLNPIPEDKDEEEPATSPADSKPDSI